MPLRHHPSLIILIGAVLAAFLAACGGTSQATPSAATAPGTAASSSQQGTADSGKGTIKLIANDWVGSEVNVAVASYLLQNKLGYSTQILNVNENEQWALLAKGDAYASLEVWPSGHEKEIQSYIETAKTVQRGSSLGVVGKIGWYVPTYVVQAHPELATWKGFADPKNAALFATDKTNVGSGQFLAGDPSWAQYDGDIIHNLGLSLQVVRVADVKNAESEILSQLDAAYKQQKPILFYFWTPHWAYITYDLTEVNLPPYSADCYAKAAAGGVACDYPADALFKIYWPGLKAAAPQAYQFLENFHYTNQDQIAMLAMVQLDKKTPQEAALTWINAHPDVWNKWLPQS
ncbi:MAG TPA: glycine betaine ABC transporter substrate-binding protein [Aggregatilineales bacterium]|nr:glycine betaine ABC transporter substrate-binding protein [Aggregatilineales bacterium]